MYETSNISNNGEFSLSIGHHSVVQKGDVGQNVYLRFAVT